MRRDFTLDSRYLKGGPRKIRVWVPDGTEDHDRLPLIVMHDGQNLFENSEATYGTAWNLAGALDEIGQRAVVVGIDSGAGLNRLDELSPWANDWIQHRTDSIDRVVGGQGADYGLMIVQELLPQLRRDLPVSPHGEDTIIAGSSMGGLMSLYLAFEYPGEFSRVACFSSAFWFARDHLEPWLQMIVQEKQQVPEKIYLDVGTMENSRTFDEEERLSYIRDTENVYKLLNKLGINDQSIKIIIAQGSSHCEAAWSTRVGPAFSWIFS